MAEVRISIIGAGSGAFSLSLIKDLCLTPNLAGSVVTMMDIDPARLDAAHDICKRYAAELGSRLGIEKTLDRRAALKGADFVINTALAAPHDRLHEGWEIARKHGYRLGGSYHIMYDEAFWLNYYQLGLMESITEDMLELCPKAWHLMVANPVITGMTHLARRYPQAKAVGLCHGYSHIFRIAEILGLARDRITYQIPGVNHFVWLNRFHYEGRDAFPILDKWIEEKSEAYWALEKNPVIRKKSVDVYKHFGVFPIGDTASWSGAAWPWWYHSDDETERKWDERPIEGWNDYFTGVGKAAADFQRLSADPSIKLSHVYKPVLSDEPMIPLVESIACDIPRVHIVNIKNSNDFVPGIPKDFEVEIPALCSAGGIQGIATGSLPNRVIGHAIRDRVVPVELELQAHLHGDRELLTELVMTDHWTTSKSQANALIDDIFELPYHKELKRHYSR